MEHNLHYTTDMIPTLENPVCVCVGIAFVVFSNEQGYPQTCLLFRSWQYGNGDLEHYSVVYTRDEYNFTCCQIQ